MPHLPGRKRNRKQNRKPEFKHLPPMTKQNTQTESTIFILMRSWVKGEFDKDDCGYKSPPLCLCFECLRFLNRAHHRNPALRMRIRSCDWTVLNVVTLGESWENNTQVNEWQWILYMFCCMMNIYICNDTKYYMIIMYSLYTNIK